MTAVETQYSPRFFGVRFSGRKHHETCRPEDRAYQSDQFAGLSYRRSHNFQLTSVSQRAIDNASGTCSSFISPQGLLSVEDGSARGVIPTYKMARVPFHAEPIGYSPDNFPDPVGSSAVAEFSIVHSL